jgi:acetylornithine/N-succinyldiaminopimelate aminotransferase
MMAASGKPGWDTLFEPIQGEAGVIPAAMDFIRGLREVVREKQLLLIFDEVQTGMGRTGSLFAYQHLGVEPDIMTLGKGIGGVPLAALLSTEAVSCFAPGDHAGTFNGDALVCAAGLAVLDTLLAPGFLSGAAHGRLSYRALT